MVAQLAARLRRERRDVPAVLPFDEVVAALGYLGERARRATATNRPTQSAVVGLVPPVLIASLASSSRAFSAVRGWHSTS